MPSPLRIPWISRGWTPPRHFTNLYNFYFIFLTFSLLLKRSSDSRHPYLVPDFSGTSFTFSIFQIFKKKNLNYLWYAESLDSFRDWSYLFTNVIENS